MAKTHNVTVSVYDTQAAKRILADITMHEAAEALGVSYKYVANTVYNKSLVHRRYQVLVTGYNIKTIIPDVYEEKVSEREKFCREWDTYMGKFNVQVGQERRKKIKITVQSLVRLDEVSYI